MADLPKAEAVPEDIVMQDEHPQRHPRPQYQSPVVEHDHASFFEGDRQLDVPQQQQQLDPPTPPQRASRPDVAAEDLQLGVQVDQADEADFASPVDNADHSENGDDQLHQLQLAARMSQALREVVGGSSNVEMHSYGPQQEAALQTLEQMETHSVEPELDQQEHDLEQNLPQHVDLPHGLPEVHGNVQPNIQQDLQQTIQQAIGNSETREGSHPENAPQQPPPPQHTQFARTPQHPVLAPAVSTTISQVASYALGDSTPARKRSKVSRACDECRRKKVKCDAASETGGEDCSNCRRSNVRCMFSRVPQKRGPSKGYIKELADRINSIEGKLGTAAADKLVDALASATRRESSESNNAVASGEDDRKRPWSQISTADPMEASRQHAWQPAARPVIPQQTTYSANGMALKPILPREPVAPAPAISSSLDAVRQASQMTQLNSVPLGVGEKVFHAYLNIVHHVLPFLPSSRETLDTHLAQCSPLVRHAFIEALDSMVKSFAAVENVHGSLITANRMLALFEAEGGKHGPISDLIYIQCLILMIINIDNYGPVALRNEHEGPTKASLLGRAAGTAYAMGLPQQAMRMVDVPEVETDQSIQVRAWWSIVILDRWHSISTATPLLISGDTVVLPQNLKAILGEANYRLTLLAYIMGHWSPASVTAPENSTPGAGARASATFHLNMEMWRAHFPTNIPPNIEPILHLAYWHCRMLAFLFMPSALIADVTWAVKESVRLLTAHHQMISPLNHHFTSLATICLMEMAKIDASRDEAVRLLNELLEANIAPSSWDDVIRAKIRSALRLPTNSTAEATASQSLQHLADLATAAETPATGSNNSVVGPTTPAHEMSDEIPKFRTSDNYEDLGFDPTPILRAGYLNAIA